MVDEDTFPEYLTAIKPFVKRAIILAALMRGFQTLLTLARQLSPMVSTPPPPLLSRMTIQKRRNQSNLKP